MEGAAASPLAMERPIQTKANRVSPPSHAPRLKVCENQFAITTPIVIRIPARSRNMRIPYRVANGK